MQFVKEEETFVFGKDFDWIPVVQVDSGQIPTIVLCLVDPANLALGFGVSIQYQ